MRQSSIYRSGWEKSVRYIAVNSFKSNPIAVLMQGENVTGDLTTQMILQVNISAFMVCLAMAGVCFAFSGIFNSSKYAIGLSGTFVGVNILANMLSMFGTLGVDGLDTQNNRTGGDSSRGLRDRKFGVLQERSAVMIRRQP